jgi:hypothetical protein
MYVGGEHDLYALEVENCAAFEQCLATYLECTEHHSRLHEGVVARFVV